MMTHYGLPRSEHQLWPLQLNILSNLLSAIAYHSPEFRCPSKISLWDFLSEPSIFRHVFPHLLCQIPHLLPLSSHNLYRRLITRSVDSLFLKGFDCQHRAISGISIVSSTSSIQFLWILIWGREDRDVGSQTFVPTIKRRLFVIVAIEQECLINRSWDLDEDQRSQVFLSVRDDFNGESLDAYVFNPFLDVFCSFDQVIPTILLPIFLWVIGLAHVFNFDEFHQGR